MVTYWGKVSDVSTTEAWWGDTESKPAPEPLSGVQALVNTLEIERNRDRLAGRAEAETWLHAHGYTRGGPVSDDELRGLREFREALRALVIQNTDGSVLDVAATGSLRAVAEGVELRVSVGSDGRVSVAPVGDGVRDRLAGLLLVVQAAQRDGTWTHLKSCANDDCRWVFYDRSRNHGGTWCDMASCGNKLKNRDFRARKRADR